MLTWFLGGGLGLLVGIAVVIGQQRAQTRAWQAVARERRALGEVRRSLDAHADDLLEEGLRLQEWEARLIMASERALRRAAPDGEMQP